ncbi:hypothetical protein [Sphingobacterium wenxiniae]|uniref:Uncharacterized protein n=1 Tax=Sphingobacterium wenxiniae TaxID=683125 RepID=A0A1I6UWC0_9SPHI|nr:hypothetical protein [Sphingobacterium wenxiniae]SFT05725.1 hypothetical protein SAMN05660206_11083 [Sphingobacterium wenxiniae]
MKKTILLGMSVMLFWSCNNAGKTTSSEETKVQTENHSAHQHLESSDAVELDNGEKWLVNEEMKPFVLKGEELVSTYIQDNQTDFKALAEQLKDQNTQLIKSCTMTGKSHDELHKWLHPHLEIVKTLENETDATKANEVVDQLQYSYKEYHEYFQ